MVLVWSLHLSFPWNKHKWFPGSLTANAPENWPFAPKGRLPLPSIFQGLRLTGVLNHLPNSQEDFPFLKPPGPMGPWSLLGWSQPVHEDRSMETSSVEVLRPDGHGENFEGTKIATFHWGWTLKWWVYPTTIGLFLLKMIMTWGVKWGYHHLRKHPLNPGCLNKDAYSGWL